MNIYIASDHGGYKLKKRIIRYIENELKQTITDMGPNEYDETDDYPDYALPLATKIIEQEDNRGIVICKNGIGVCIATNKVKGIRAGIGYNLMAAETMMADDNTNILCLASKALSEEHALAITKKWLETEFSNKPRHVQRLEKIKMVCQQ
jgi:ribose 5-phosphate isomerase B